VRAAAARSRSRWRSSARSSFSSEESERSLRTKPTRGVTRAARRGARTRGRSVPVVRVELLPPQLRSRVAALAAVAVSRALALKRMQGVPLPRRPPRQARTPAPRVTRTPRARGRAAATCPLSTGGRTRRVQLVRGEGRGGARQHLPDRLVERAREVLGVGRRCGPEVLPERAEHNLPRASRALMPRRLRAAARAVRWA